MKLGRLVVAGSMAVIVAALLVVVMFKLVDREWEEKPPTPPQVFPVFNQEPDPPKTPEELPPERPKEVEPPPDVTIDPPSIPGGGGGEVITPPDVPKPGQNDELGTPDGGPLPLVRVEPIYPPRAAERRQEGWVIVEFTISETGAVLDPVVVSAEPANIFDRAARQAVAKWKYKPSIVDGKPVAKSGVRTQLTFKLSQ